MPHKTRPMAALLLFTGLNVVLVSTISPVYDFVCFLPYWERRNVGVKNAKLLYQRVQHQDEDELIKITEDAHWFMKEGYLIFWWLVMVLTKLWMLAFDHFCYYFYLFSKRKSGY
ncbi:hypothetical protein HanXRQr2_Chr13g0568151 [Helianthus annuus]|uniref:Uncharacterized protein n=1 Tax=Helianthus annuus TaxID=4232 RepID=A0A9K3HA19_HELAN|nr:hypothetical protein HanXRQr2_Chr13g0568151 [Helianthus annuus]KAJ0496253.1 hypothetical protein HanHA89_Chr13g0497581 [Helianthus annuus]